MDRLDIVRIDITATRVGFDIASSAVNQHGLWFAHCSQTPMYNIPHRKKGMKFVSNAKILIWSNYRFIDDRYSGILGF